MQKRGLWQKIFGDKIGPEGMKQFRLVNSTSETFYSWDGNLYSSDIVRSAIRPKVNAIGKLKAKHIKGYGEDMKINPVPYIRNLLDQPNPYMSMQDFLSKMVNQRELTHNAFAYVSRDVLGYPIAIYPIPFSDVKLVEYGGEMFVKFVFVGGRHMTVPYQDLIHLRKDFNSHDIFGDSGIQPLQGVMEVISTMDQGMVNAVKNSAIIRWILSFKSPLRPEDRVDRVDEFVKNYLSFDSKGVAVSDTSYDLKQVEDKSYVPNASQTDKATQRLYSYFGVNDAIVQNKWKDEEWNAFYESEIEPIIIQLSDSFTKVLFTPQARSLGNRIVFDSSNVSSASNAVKLGFVAMVDRGGMVINEWRAMFNLSPIEGGDVPIRRLDTESVKEGNNSEQNGNDNGQDTKPVE